MQLKHPTTGDIIEVTSNVDGWLTQGWLSIEPDPSVVSAPGTDSRPVPAEDKQIPSSPKGKK